MTRQRHGRVRGIIKTDKILIKLEYNRQCINRRNSILEFNQPLLGFGISNFRSFGSTNQLVGPLKKINLIVGENNSGKSNISRYIRRVLAAPQQVLAQDDVCKRLTLARTAIPILVSLDDMFWISMGIEPSNIKVVESFKVFFKALKYADESSNTSQWLEIVSQASPQIDHLSINPTQIGQQHFKESFQVIFRTLFPGSSGGDLNFWINETLKKLANLAKPSFKSFLIPAARKLETRLAQFTEEFGERKDNANPVIDTILAYSNPTYQQSSDFKKFEKIQHFVRQVLGDNTITLSVPSDRSTINIQQHGRWLPIESLGTGVFQAILLAAQCTQIENSIVCIEEPELHLHPEVQRQVIIYLAEETNNQYFVTTHSAHILDAVDCCVIGVHIEDGLSIVHHPIDGQQRRAICHKLGYRPSDLLQANSLIWVEGPSDRTYINSWLRAKCPNLREGLHYSFAVYGGKVLSNFSASLDDEDLDEIEMNEFILLLPINRFPAVIMDSDLRQAGGIIGSVSV
jgi:AAA domain, putative AbiEii toxin, Type IV TA system